jgi:hypothetical protein
MQVINHWLQISGKIDVFQHIKMFFVILKVRIGTIFTGSINK